MQTKTIQFYPDDAEINRVMRAAGKLGWNVISNQRCQEYHGGNIATFNKVTFQRDKSPTTKYKEFDIMPVGFINLTAKPQPPKKPEKKEYKIGGHTATMIFGLAIGVITLITSPKSWFWYVVAGLGFLGGLFSLIPAKKNYQKALELYDAQLKKFPEVTKKWEDEYKKKINEGLKAAYVRQDYYGGYGTIIEDDLIICSKYGLIGLAD